MNQAKGESAGKYRMILVYVLIAMPVLVYFFVVNKYALNLCFRDDNPAVLQFLNTYKTSNGFVDHFTLLFGQLSSEHRIFFSRLVYLTYYQIAGNVNFKNLLFIGNLQLVVVLIVSVKFIKKAIPQSWEIPSVLMSLFLFDFTNWNNADWTMAAMQNYSVIMLFALSIYFYTSNRLPFILLAAFFQIVCIYSSGNGAIASLSIVVVNLLSREKNKFYLSLLVLAVFIPLYFFHFNPAAGDHTPPPGPVKFFTAFLHVTSSHIYLGRLRYNGYITVFFSFVMLVFLAISFPLNKKLVFDKKFLPFIGLLLFIFGTIAAMCYVRNASVLNAPPSRYLIYPNWLLGVIFATAWLKFYGFKNLKIVTGCFFALMLIVYMVNFRMGTDALAAWRKDMIHNVPDPWTPVDQNKEKAALEQSCSLHIYCVDSTLLRITN